MTDISLDGGSDVLDPFSRTVLVRFDVSRFETARVVGEHAGLVLIGGVFDRFLQFDVRGSEGGREVSSFESTDHVSFSQHRGIGRRQSGGSGCDVEIEFGR